MTRDNIVTSAIDQKIYNLVIDYLEEKSLANRKNLSSDELQDPLAGMESANNLTITQTTSIVQQRELSLKRVKKAQLEKSISKVLRIIREDEAEEIGTDEQALSAHHSEVDGNGELEGQEERDGEENGNNMMVVKDTNSTNKSVVSLWKTPTEDESENNEADNVGLKRKSRETSKTTTLKRQRRKVNYTTPTLDFSTLGGIDNVTTQLLEIIGLPILHPEIYLSTGVEPPRGVLLYGPPGCGKTTVANALAGELKVPFINISAPSIVSGMSGESEKKLRDLFEEAKSVAPCIIFMDEIDAITPKRDGGAQREMERRIVAQLLTLMDELRMENTNNKPVIVIGATNRPDSLDSALRRAGRFDREICLNVPNESQRESILRAMTKDIKLDGESLFNYRELSKLTPGYVGADLKSLVTAAGVFAIKRIFESLIQREDEKEAVSDGMDIDIRELLNDQQGALAQAFSKKSDVEKLSTIQKFLAAHPDPLTGEQLEPLSITYDDFINALHTVQPSAKREGFATVPDVTWNKVGALSSIRTELHMCIVQPVKKPELFLKVGITAPSGVLMWGPPGCGKTLLAKAVANESRANFISIKGPELLNKYVGESEKAVRQVFQRARASTPCIIFFDELDALVPRRDNSMSESSSRVVNTLLTELDGLNDRKGVFVIGATNRPDMIDPAMLRPGRLDKTLYIQLPTPDERFEILKTIVRANQSPIDNDVNLHEIAHEERCRNFSGADLSSLVKEAAVSALKRSFFHSHKLLNLDLSQFYDVNDDNEIDIKVNKSDFDQALSRIRPSVSDRDRAKYERLNKKLGWDVIGPESANDGANEGANNELL